jgi:hypothetical protein
MECLVVEMERMHWRAEALGAGARDGIAFLSHAARQRARKRMSQETSDLGAVPGQQRGAQAIEIVEHRCSHLA